MPKKISNERISEIITAAKRIREQEGLSVAKIQKRLGVCNKTWDRHIRPMLKGEKPVSKGNTNFGSRSKWTPEKIKETVDAASEMISRGVKIEDIKLTLGIPTNFWTYKIRPGLDESTKKKIYQNRREYSKSSVAQTEDTEHSQGMRFPNEDSLQDARESAPVASRKEVVDVCKSAGIYNPAEEDKSVKNDVFFRMIMPRDVLEIHSHDKSNYTNYLPVARVWSNDIRLDTQTFTHKPGLSLMKEILYGGYVFDMVDLDPYNLTAIYLLPFAALIAEKGLIVSVCCGHVMHHRNAEGLRYLGVPYDVPVTHDLVVARLVSIIEAMGVVVQEEGRCTLSDKGVRVYFRIISKDPFKNEQPHYEFRRMIP